MTLLLCRLWRSAIVKRKVLVSAIAVGLAVLAPVYAAELSGPVDPLASTAAQNENGIARALNDEQTLESARAMLASGDLSASQEAELRNLTGSLLLDRKDFARAIQEFDAAIRVAPDNDEAYGKRGYAHLLNGDAERALADAARALELNPNSIWGHFARGWVLYEAGRLDEAVSEFDVLVALTPQEQFGYWGRINVFRRNGEREKLVAELDRLITLFPRQPEGFVLRATVFLLDKNYDKAIADFTSANRIEPTHAGALRGRARTHLEKGDPARAIQDLTAAISLGADAENHYWRGLAYAVNKDANKAIAISTPR